MDIIAVRQQKRADQISILSKSIKMSEGQINYKELVISAMANLRISRKTAKEYVDVALFNLNIKL